MIHKMVFVLFMSLFSSHVIYGRVANDTCTLTSEDVSMFKRHLIALKKLEIIESITRKYYPENSLIFYFATPNYNEKGTTLLVLDSSNSVIEGFQMPACCDSTVFDSKEKLKRGSLKKLDKISLMISLNSNEFYKCLMGYDSRFEILVFVKDGKILSGLIIGDQGPSSYTNNYLIGLKNCIRSSVF